MLARGFLIERGVAPVGRNRTGPPCSVGRPTGHAPGRRRADRPRTRWPAGRQARRQRYRQRQMTDAS